MMIREIVVIVVIVVTVIVRVTPMKSKKKFLQSPPVESTTGIIHSTCVVAAIAISR